MDLPPEVLTLIGVIVTALAALGGAWLSSKVGSQKNRADAQAQFVNDLQEQVRDARAELKELRAETQSAFENLAQAKSEALQIQEIAKLQMATSWGYIYQLRSHIEAKLDPPAPPIPEDLMAFLPQKVVINNN